MYTKQGVKYLGFPNQPNMKKKQIVDMRVSAKIFLSLVNKTKKPVKAIKYIIRE